MNKRKSLAFLFFAVALFHAGICPGFEMNSQNYSITWDVLCGGGGIASSPNYQITDLIGQSSPVGESSGTVYYNDAGYISDPTPLPADMAKLYFAVTSTGIKIQWSTGAESDMTGFNVWRGISGSQEPVKINESLILTQTGGTSGSDYSFTAAPDVYSVEVLKSDGTSEMIAQSSDNSCGDTLGDAIKILQVQCGIPVSIQINGLGSRVSVDTLILIWSYGDQTVTGFNVWRSIGSAEPVKLNTSLIAKQTSGVYAFTIHRDVYYLEIIRPDNESEMVQASVRTDLAGSDTVCGYRLGDVIRILQTVGGMR